MLKTQGASQSARSQKLDNRTIANPFDGKVNFGGYHPKLSPARPDSIANWMVNNRPAFSALARNVKHHANGVTSYDITPVGPPIAYKLQALSHLEVNGKKISIVEVKFAPDKATGSKSVFEGRAYQIFGEGKDGPFVAELWDNVKASTLTADAGAALHNAIVDGQAGKGGFRGMASSALAEEKKNGGAVAQNIKLPGVKNSDSLTAFIKDPKNIPGLDAATRAALLKQLG